MTSTRTWKPGMSPCLGFKPDGSAAYVLLTSYTHSHHGSSTSDTVHRAVFADKKLEVAMKLAHERQGDDRRTGRGMRRRRRVR